jgi:hypothetical protein
MLRVADSSSVAFQRTDGIIGGMLIDSTGSSRATSKRSELDLMEVNLDMLRGAGFL